MPEPQRTFIIRKSPLAIDIFWKTEAVGYFLIIILEIVKIMESFRLLKLFFPSSSVSVEHVEQVIPKKQVVYMYSAVTGLSFLLMFLESLHMYPPSDIVGFFFQAGLQNKNNNKSNTKKNKLAFKDLTMEEKEYFSKIKDEQCYEYDYVNHEKNSLFVKQYNYYIEYSFIIGFMIQIFMAFIVIIRYSSKSFSKDDNKIQSLSKVYPYYTFFIYWALSAGILASFIIILGSIVGIIFFFRLVPYTKIRDLPCRNLPKVVNPQIFRNEFSEA